MVGKTLRKRKWIGGLKKIRKVPKCQKIKCDPKFRQDEFDNFSPVRPEEPANQNQGRNMLRNPRVTPDNEIYLNLRGSAELGVIIGDY